MRALVAAGVTTGPDIIKSGLAAVVFAVIGGVFIAVSRANWPEFYGRRNVKLWNWGVLGLVGAGGSVAILVGLICWATGTEFR